MNYIFLAELLLAAVSGGGIVAATLRYMLTKRKTTDERYERMLESMERAYDRVRSENELRASERDGLLDRVRELELEVRLLQQQLVLMESAHQELPIPMWLKDPQGRVLSCNAAYVDHYLTPRGFSREDYVGHTDSDVWPEDTAALFRANDKEVFRTGSTMHASEMVPGPDGKPRPTLVVKYVRYAGRLKIGVAGIAIPATTPTADYQQPRA